jgi:tetratricopeptide (TPR) repeat protein
LNNQEIDEELNAELTALLNNSTHLSNEQLCAKLVERLEKKGVGRSTPLSPTEIVAQWKDHQGKPYWEVRHYASVLANMKAWDKALLVAGSIVDDAERYETVSEIALRLVSAGLLDKAEAVLKSVPIESGDSEKIFALTNLADHLCKQGKTEKAIELLLQEAEPTACAKPDSLSKADRFLEIALELAKVGMYDDALRLLKAAIPLTIYDFQSYRHNVEASKVLSYIPCLLIQFGEYQKARELAKLVPQQFRKRAFQEIEEREQERQ